jgi:hypothetical protein
LKNILLIAKAKALHEGSDTIRLYHIQRALNNVTINNPKVETFLYRAFGASLDFPEAKYTPELLQNIHIKEPLVYDKNVKNIFTQLKNRNIDIDLMNISELNCLDNLEFTYLDFAQTLFASVDNERIKSLYDIGYIYESEEVIEALGVPAELVDELIEDYVEQILRTYSEFQLHISLLWEKDFLGESLDFTPLRDLAHKNLGVAKNLRIEDATILLSEIKQEDDLKIISQCLELLVCSAIKLKPTKACEAMFDSIDELKKFKKLHSNKEKILQTIKS